MSKRTHNERIIFRFFTLSCCGHMLCWVNPRYPSYCPECGTHIYPNVKGDATIIDNNAHLRYHTEES